MGRHFGSIIEYFSIGSEVKRDQERVAIHCNKKQ